MKTEFILKHIHVKDDINISFLSNNKSLASNFFPGHLYVWRQEKQRFHGVSIFLFGATPVQSPQRQSVRSTWYQGKRTRRKDPQYENRWWPIRLLHDQPGQLPEDPSKANLQRALRNQARCWSNIEILPVVSSDHGDIEIIVLCQTMLQLCPILNLALEVLI